MKPIRTQDYIPRRPLWVRGDLVQKFKEMCVLNDMKMGAEIESLIFEWIGKLEAQNELEQQEP